MDIKNLLETHLNAIPTGAFLAASKKRIAAVRKLNLDEVLSEGDIRHIVNDIILLRRDKIDVDGLLRFLRSKYDELTNHTELKTSVRKLVFFYDRLASGWF